MAEETRIALNKRVLQLDPRKIKLLDINPHFMRHETFQRLVANIRQDGDLLGNTPFCWRLHDDETRQPLLDGDGQPIYEVLSGNHRVKAAVEVGLPLITVEVTDEYLTPDRRKAIQLSQNAVHGDDDITVLKNVYDSIQDPSFRIYSGLDDQTLKLMADVNVESLSEAHLLFQTITLAFLPHERETIETIWEQVKKDAAGSKALWLARWQDYDRFMDSLEAASSASGIKNVATALLIILEVFSNHLHDLQAHYLDADGEPVDAARHVPIASLFDQPLAPAREVAQIQRVLKRIMAQSNGEIGSPWAALLHALTQAETPASKPTAKGGQV